MQQQKQHFDIYEQVTNTIIALLQQGTIPWRKPWSEAGLPMNLLTGRVYTGINYLLLNALPYEQQFYLTWNQIKSVGGSVQKGEKGHMIVFRKTVEKPDTTDTTKTIKKSVWRYYMVFNSAQCKDVPSRLLPTPRSPKRENKPLWTCESLIDDMVDCPPIKHEENRAYYVPSRDYINMPDLEIFETSESYYCVLFHELIHATGHASRLNRKEIMESPDFGRDLYSVEELVAEIGACYLNSLCGIANETISNNVAYIDNWLRQLKNDKSFILKASYRAQKAVDYIMNVKRSTAEPETLPAEYMLE